MTVRIDWTLRGVLAIVLASLLSVVAVSPSIASEPADQASPACTLETRNGAFVATEGHASLFSDAPNRPFLGGTFGYALRTGWRWPRWATHLHVEHNMWVASEQSREVVLGVLNVGIGVEYVFAGGLVRSALTVGPSILLFDTLIDDRGEVGVFVNVRPIGLRWRLGKDMTLGLDPIGFSLVAPVLSRIPLVLTQYRTYLYLEYSL